MSNFLESIRAAVGEPREILRSLLQSLGILAALLLVVVYFAAAANAAQFHVPNEGGGAMVITDEPCVVEGENFENLRRAFSFVRTGESIEGCWVKIADDVVRILWIMPDGEVRPMNYPVSAFRKVTAT